MIDVVLSGYRWFLILLSGFVGFGWGIVALSFICSVMMMPLMRAVAGIVRREAEYQSVILPQIADINIRFSNDVERHEHLEALYERYSYSPLSPVKKVLPLFVQIPFLLLTYYMLKGTVQLNGVPFGPLHDLGAPDGLVYIASERVNLLPFLMTGINILTVFSTPGFTKRDWVQASGIALLFLVLLYEAPAALLLYWTLNNVITFARVSCANRFAGFRLFYSRLIKARSKACDFRLSIPACAILSASLTLLGLYLDLLYHNVPNFNKVVSFWLMNVVLATAHLVNCRIFLEEDRWCRVAAKTAASFSVAVSAIVLAVRSSSVLTYRYVCYFYDSVDLSLAFLVLLGIGLVPFCISLFRDRSAIVRSLADTLRSEWQWGLIPVLLIVHYSYSSEHFKLPFESVVKLVVNMELPMILLPLLMAVMYRARVSPLLVFRIVVGAEIGMLLIPMITREAGFFLGWQSNIVLRILVISLVAAALSRFRNQKAAIVFVALLAFAFALNLFYGAQDKSEPGISDEKSVETNAADCSKLLNLTCKRTNNVYLMVYDGYAHDIVLKGVGIKNDNTKEWLKSHGFSDYCAYSLGNHTIAGMSSMFAIGGVRPGSQRSMTAGNNVFCDSLKRSGYHTSYLLSSYCMPGKGERKPGDYYFPTAAAEKKPEEVLLPLILSGFLSQSADTFNAYTDEQWESAKKKVLCEAVLRQSFVYAHTDLPAHLVPNAKYRKSDREEFSLYERRLATANLRIRNDIAFLLENDPRAIVIIASDHGGYVTGEKFNDARNILDYFGVQLLVKWPDDYEPCLRKIRCLQDAALEVLIYLTDDQTLARYQSDGANVDFCEGRPTCTVRDSLIQIGRDKGLNLFETAEREFLEKGLKTGE